MNPIPRPPVRAVVVESDVVFTLAQLCRACGTDRAQVLALVGEGVLDPTGSGPHDWRFAGPALRTARTAVRLSGELELGAAGTALVVDGPLGIHSADAVALALAGLARDGIVELDALGRARLAGPTEPG